MIKKINKKVQRKRWKKKKVTRRRRKKKILVCCVGGGVSLATSSPMGRAKGNSYNPVGLTPTTHKVSSVMSK